MNFTEYSASLLHNGFSLNRKQEALPARPQEASVPHRAIMGHAGHVKGTLTRIMAFARANPETLVLVRMPGSGQPSKFSTANAIRSSRRWVDHSLLICVE